MKAKRILSILLTGSMLLSLLPVSALAAAPVFDAPAQTTAKKAAPLVQEADASRSTEEEAATRSSRDLDAENGTADSFTIQLNADGTPAGYGDGEHWYYSAASGCQLDTGVFALQPSSEPEAESALKARLFRIGDNAELVRGTVGCDTINDGTVFDGIFQGKVSNFRTISGGTFEEVVEMNESTEGTTIEGGTFKKGIELNAYSPTITDGLFDGKVSAAEDYSGMLMLSISGGLFTNAAAISTISPNNLSITGGYFVNKPALREGNDIAFTSVSDQDGRAFQVPVNKGWSEGYETLYVPSGSSEQPNTITVKTDTALIDCLAGDVSIMDNVRTNADGSYAIDVHSPASIVLVTEEPAPPTPGEPGGELDPEFSSGAAALGVVLATAGLGYVTYVCGSSLYLHYVLPDGFIPSTRQELATVLWTTAGKPDPVSTALYTDIPADDIEQQKAARWCAEQGLLSDHGETFGPDTKVTNARIIRAWNSLKKVPVTIK